MATTREKLLITGVTGYIGFQTLTIALERGYNVRAVVRGDKNVADLRRKSPVVADAHDTKQLDFAIVPDFLRDDAIYNVLHGVTAIIHLASPLAIQTDDLESIVAPAIDMVMVVLEAAHKVDTIKRLVITSSCVTMVPFEWNMAPDTERLYNASDINANPVKPFKSPMEAYWASKAYARLAVSDFVAEKKPRFDFVSLLPSVVIGVDTRIEPGAKTDVLLQGTRTAVLSPALDGSLNSPFPYVGVPVHVADVARAHVDAVECRIRGNAEYILSSDTPDGVQWDRDVHAIARKYFAAEVESGLLPLRGSLTSIRWRLDVSDTEKTFGWTFTSFEDTMKALIAQYLELRKNE